MPDLMNSELFQTYISMIVINLLITLAVEVPLAIALGVRKMRDIQTVFLTNCVTNPTVVSIHFLLLHFGATYATILAAILAMELAVVLCEGLVYRKLLPRGKLNPYVLSLILNACSYGVGIVLEQLGL